MSGFRNAWQVLIQNFPPKPKFSVDQVPDLSGRVALVTGGNTGIGYETVKVLLRRNAKVYLAARSKEKGKAAVDALVEETGKEAIFLELDLASLASVKEAATGFLSKEEELHMLFNNAGVMWPPLDALTAEGYDLQWGTNVLGHFYLDELLLPALDAGARSSPDGRARVITTSSGGAYLGKLQYDTMRGGEARRKKTTEDLYFQSKLGNAVVAHQMAKRYANKNIVSISVNPGSIQTDLQRNASALQRKILNATINWPAPYGALTQLFAATVPEALQYNGEFLIPYARLGKCRAEVYDDAVGEELWRWLEGEVRAFEGAGTPEASPGGAFI